MGIAHLNFFLVAQSWGKSTFCHQIGGKNARISKFRRSKYDQKLSKIVLFKNVTGWFPDTSYVYLDALSHFSPHWSSFSDSPKKPESGLMQKTVNFEISRVKIWSKIVKNFFVPKHHRMISWWFLCVLGCVWFSFDPFKTSCCLRLALKLWEF